ncbi:MAG: ClpX C4-type zinc finger protein [Chloroflexota bacterium]
MWSFRGNDDDRRSREYELESGTVEGLKTFARRRLVGRPAGLLLAVVAHPARWLAGKRIAASRCSFCGKSYPDIRQLITGPDGVGICDACIRSGEQILVEEKIIT